MKENNALLRLDGVGFKTDDAVIFTQFSASRRRIQVDYRPFRLREKYLAEDYRLAAQPNLRAPVLRRCGCRDAVAGKISPTGLLLRADAGPVR